MTRCSKLRACRVGGAIEAGLSIRYSALDFQDPGRCRSLACTVVVQKEDAMHRSASRQPFARTARMGFLRPTTFTSTDEALREVGVAATGVHGVRIGFMPGEDALRRDAALHPALEVAAWSICSRLGCARESRRPGSTAWCARSRTRRRPGSRRSLRRAPQQ